jgi:c-di-GMP-binding flagellar brake protein YcgR
MNSGNLKIAGTGERYFDEVKSCLTVNEILQVRCVNEEDRNTYRSRIQDVNDGKLVISWPTCNGLRLLVHVDQMLNFYVMRDGVPHTFSGLVDETDAEPLPRITIILGSAIEKIQRRQNFRVKCLVPVELFASLGAGPKAESPSSVSIRTVSTDLSAGGISFRHGVRMPEGSLVDIKLGIPDGGPAIKIPCSVVYSEYFSENQVLYRTGLRFLAMSEGERARIVRYVYRTQLQSVHM